MRIFKLKNT